VPLCREFPYFNARAVFHRGVVEIDLEPVSDDNRGTREGEDVLHDAIPELAPAGEEV
jgi:hypothetical protein